jgi:hypothetical protein
MSSLAVASQIKASTFKVSAGDLGNLSISGTTVDVGYDLRELQVPPICKAFRIIAAQNPAPFYEMAVGVDRHNAVVNVGAATELSGLHTDARNIAHTIMVLAAVKEMEGTFNLSA